MNRDTRNVRMVRSADKVNGWAAQLVTDAVEHIHHELANCDGWPGQTMGDGMPAGQSDMTLVERIADRRYDLASTREQLRDDIDAWEQLLDSIVIQCRRILGVRIERIEGQRCAGTVDPTCTNWASDHRHPETGELVSELCDSCFHDACPSCRRRAAETRRRGMCEACARKDLRARVKDVA